MSLEITPEWPRGRGLALLEAELSADVKRILDKHGAFSAHYPDSRRMQGKPGFPDWVVAGKGGLQFWELKTDAGMLSPEQRGWSRVIRRAGGTYLVLRPADLHSGLIEASVIAVTKGGK